MNITLNATDLHKILVEKFGEQDFNIYLKEDLTLLCKIWREPKDFIKQEPAYKFRMASFPGFSASLELLDKRIRPSRYGGSDISKDLTAIQNEELAEDGKLKSL